MTEVAFKNAPHSNHKEQRIIEALRKDDALTISLVADDQGTLVGHVAVSPVAISACTEEWYGIGPIAVVPRRQGQGIGSLLMQEALTELKKRGAAGVVLLGDPDFYSRFGFEQSKDLFFPGVPPEYFHVLNFSSSKAKGDVTYHSAFKSHG